MKPQRQTLYIDPKVDPKLQTYLASRKAGDVVEFDNAVFKVASADDNGMIRLTLTQVTLSRDSEPVETNEKTPEPQSSDSFATAEALTVLG